MADIGKLAMQMSVNPGSFHQELTKAEQHVQSLGGTIAQIGSGNFSVSGMLAGISGPVGIAIASVTALGGAMAVAGAKGIAFIGTVAGLSRSLQIEVGAANNLALAAERTGIDMGTLSSGINRMEVTLGKAKAGSAEAAAAFETLGLSANALSGMGADQQLALLGDRLNRLGDLATRSAAAQAIFGKGWQEIDPLLRQGSRGLEQAAAMNERFGLSVSKLDVSNLREMKQSSRNVGMAFQGLSLSIGQALIPLLTALNNALATVLLGIRPVFDLLGGIIGLIGSGITVVFKAVGLAEINKELSLTKSGMEALHEKAEATRDNSGQLSPAGDRLRQALNQLGDAKLAQEHAFWADEHNRAEADIARLEKQIAYERNLIDVEQRLLAEQAASQLPGPQSEETLKAADDIAKLTDRLREQADTWGMNKREAAAYVAALAGVDADTIERMELESRRVEQQETWDREQRAVAQMLGQKSDKVNMAGAQMEGSSAAISTVNKAMVAAQTGGGDPTTRITDALEKVRALHQANLEQTRRIADAVQGTNEEEI